jgi:hypothetical protein
MRQSLLIVSVGFITLPGCSPPQESINLLPQESDAVFKGVSRSQHVSEHGLMVFYYFPAETPLSLANRIEHSSFFQSERWRPFYAVSDDRLSSRRDKDTAIRASDKYRLTAMTISAGKDKHFLDDASKAGSTFILIAGNVK